MARVLVDTGVLVDHLRGARRFDPAGDEVHISTITRAELYAGASVDDTRLERLLGAMTEIPVDSAIAQRAGRIGRLANVSTEDALVAATALEHNLVLVTRNIWAFKGIDGLDAMAPPIRP